MYARGVRKIPVIDEDKVIGIITATDLINQFAVSTEEDMKNMYYQSIAKIFVQRHYV
jgi:predicted transcriptional regulator